MLAAGLLTAALSAGCGGSNEMPKPDKPHNDDSADSGATLGPDDRYLMAPLSEDQREVIEDAATEAPFSGEYWNTFDAGLYVCRRCGSPLYRSEDKFDSQCGWPSFDDEIAGAVLRRPDPDGRRTEIVCAHCGAHLGHVFLGEGLTPANTRHCVNSLSMQFIPADQVAAAQQAQATQDAQALQPAQTDQAVAYFAGGCFWGVEHYLGELDGVLSTTTGYMGGHTPQPSYEQVCGGQTGHAETVKVVFDPARLDYETLARRFFEIHDPTQYLRQGNDRGSQYRSAIFYTNDQQKRSAAKLIALLREKGYDATTELSAAGDFWEAEAHHQDYLARNPGGYCNHGYVNRFDESR